jgi:hypothetical protein
MIICFYLVLIFYFYLLLCLRRVLGEQHESSLIGSFLCNAYRFFFVSLNQNVYTFANDVQPIASDLRRSTRKRRISVNLEDYTDSSGAEDEDMMVRIYSCLIWHFDNVM